jgi:hypothetical protein
VNARELSKLGRQVTMERREAGLEYARRWKAADRGAAARPQPQAPPVVAFPYPGHRHCGEWR